MPPAFIPTGETGDALGWRQVDAGYLMSCGLLTDHRMVCWGDPDRVAKAPTGPFEEMFVSDSGCGRTADGSVECWCMRSDQELCDHAPSRSGLVRVDGGEIWACAEDHQHLLRCWGQGPEPRFIPPDKPVLDWDLESNFACAVLENHSVYCWGDTDVLALADPDPALAPPADLDYTAVAVGRSHACALDTAREAHCWGSTGLREPFPQAPPGPWSSIFSYNAIACGLHPDGRAECWFDLDAMLDPWFVPDERWDHIGLGEWDACGLTLDGRAVCFPAPYDSAGEQDPPDLADL